VPIAPRNPESLPDNVTILLADITEPLRFPDGSMDMVHARCISTSVCHNSAHLESILIHILSCPYLFVSSQVRNYPLLLSEIARVLKPGGLFLGGEWARGVRFAPNRPFQQSATHAPGTHAMFEAISGVLNHRQGIFGSFAPHIRGWLLGSSNFHNVVEKKCFMPIGPWATCDDAETLRGDIQEGRFSLMDSWDVTRHLRIIGRYYRGVVDRYAKNMSPMLSEGGLPRERITQLLRDHRRDLRDVNGMVTTYHMVYAIKI
jgi:SAM-dependent methyltransferase